MQTGSVKKKAGERSGVKRSAKSALVVKRRWLDNILAGRKTWEIRGGPTTKRGWIHFAQSGSTGKLMGRARLVGCHRVSRSAFEQDDCDYCVDSWTATIVWTAGMTYHTTRRMLGSSKMLRGSSGRLHMSTRRVR